MTIIFYYKYFLFICSGMLTVKGTHFTVDNCKTSPSDLSASFDTIHSASCSYPCYFASAQVWGSEIYTYDSPLCRSALHDNRISFWNRKKRQVTFVRKSGDAGQYYGSFQQGIRTTEYGRLNSALSGYYYFTSPKYEEPLLDVTSISRGFLKLSQGPVIQECHLGSNAKAVSVKFQHYLTNYEFDLKPNSLPPTIPQGKTIQNGSNVWTSVTWPDDPSGYFYPGGLWCQISNNSYSHVLSLSMRNNADFYPERWTVTTSVDENASLRMRRFEPASSITWRKDGISFRYFDNQIAAAVIGDIYELNFFKVTVGNRGIYSVHGNNFDLRGISRLIVRGCKINKYGPLCEFDCPACQNGGVCHDIMGGCICPPGFNGTLCEYTCGDNHYGSDCSLLCSDSNPGQERTCRGLLFCLPDPFGCTCGTGFRGYNCITPCYAGEFGAGCSQRRKCYCNGDDHTCDRYTGLCPGDCLPGWKGTACNISYPFLSVAPLVLSGTSPQTQKIRVPPWDGTLGNGNPVVYVIEVKIKDNNQTFREVSRLNYTGGVQETSLENLTPNTRYIVRAVLLDEDGRTQRDEAPFSEFRTACGAPEGPLEDVVVNFSETNRVRASWKIPDSSTWHCDKVQVRVHYNDVKSSYSQVIGDGKTDTSIPSEPYTEWKVKLRLETPNGEAGNWTQVYEGHTAEDAPSKVDDIEPKFDSETQLLTVTWRKPEKLNGLLKYYAVRLLQQRWLHCDGILNYRTYRNVTEELVMFEGANYSTTYRVHVQGFTVKLGELVYRDLDTKEGAPSGQPQQLKPRNIGSTWFSVDWLPPNCEERSGRIASYSYTFSGRSPWDLFSKTATTQLQFIRISTLMPYTDYKFRVHACTSQGCGETFAALNITTLSETPPAPKNLTVYSTTMTSVSLSWSDPYPPYGIITGYGIFCKMCYGLKRDVPLQNNTNFFCKEKGRKEKYCHTIENLDANKNYTFQVYADNENGNGESAVTYGFTDESEPGPPEKLNVSERSTSSLHLVWEAPYKRNGIITGYQVNLTQAHQGGLNLTQILNDTELTVDNLSPATMYNVSVSASTFKGYGESISRVFSTRSPDLQTILKDTPEVGNILDNSVEIFIKHLDLSSVPNSSYLILVKNVLETEDGKRKKRCVAEHSGIRNRHKRCSELTDDTENYQHLLMNYNTSTTEYAAGKLFPKDIPLDGKKFLVGDEKVYNGYYNRPLVTGHTYQFGVAVVSEYAQDPKFCVKYSEPITVRMKAPVETSSLGLLVGIVILCLLAMVAALLFLYYKKPQMFPFINNILKNKKGPRSVLSESSVSLELYSDCLVLPPSTNTRIAVADLEEFVKKAESNGQIVQEFRSISKAPVHSKEIARLPENKAKNRYGNMLPFDHNRVTLNKLENDPYSDYINASYVNGYKCLRKYIATQGPKPVTVVDFWRMVWQENASKIVMITNVMENGKVKCEKYWPDTTDRYGQLTVQLIDTVTFSDYVIRSFLVSQTEDYVWQVTQFHFTTWPDHSVPMYPMAIGGFLKRMRAHMAHSKNPTIVHCSAGVGRTGTLILLDSMMDMALAEDAVDLPAQLFSMRQQRLNQIESSDQYIFIYRTLAEVLCGTETSILCSEFCKEFGNLKKEDPVTKRMPIQDHFERLEKVGQPLKLSDCKTAVANYTKNRNSDIIPPDRSRPILPASDSESDSNYINAVYVNGYKLRDAFLVTQCPLPTTVEDFWRMVKSTNTRTIVLLQDPDQKYWPEVEDTPVNNAGSITIETTSVENSGTDIIIRTFTIIGPGIKEEVVVKQFHLQVWPKTHDVPSSPGAILELIEKVEHWQKQTRSQPLTVQCFDGASACGVFCASMFVCDKIKAEQEVDVYLAVRSIRHNRPQFVNNLTQYLFCHQVALNFLDSFETYANFQ